MTAPKIKGILLVAPVADITRLVQEGRITRDDLETELGAEARKVVTDGVSIVSWYAVGIYRDIARLLMKFDGKGHHDLAYMRRRGERAGQRLVESGLYQQLDFLKRRTGERREERLSHEVFEQTVRMVVSMQAALIQGVAWTVTQDPEHRDRIQIELADADGMPEECAQAACGIVTGITKHGGADFAWRYERPSIGRIVFRMDRDIGVLHLEGTKRR
ncbi:MAG TPA: hypothetical protein VMW35_00040 [Myxococcota bacterium]|nr:hypothetical protein [Myxococcota bacterium]